MFLVHRIFQRLTAFVSKIPGCGRKCGALHLYPEDLQRKVTNGEFDYPKRCVHHINSSRLPANLQVATATGPAPAAAAAVSGRARSSAAHPSDLHGEAGRRLACVEALVKKMSDTFALHAAQSQLEGTEHRETFVALKNIVDSMEHEARARLFDVHDMVEHTLRSMVDSVAVADEKGAKGILRTDRDHPIPLFHSPNFASQTGKCFRGDCFVRSEPRADGWYEVGENMWLHADSIKDGYGRPFAWLPVNETNSGVYQSLIPAVRVWYRVRAFDWKSPSRADDRDIRTDLFDLIESRLARHVAAPTLVPAMAPLEAVKPPASEATAHVQAGAREAELLGEIAALELRLAEGGAPFSSSDSPSLSSPRNNELSVQACSLLEVTEPHRAAQSAADKSRTRAAAAHSKKCRADAVTLEKANRKLQAERDRERALNLKLREDAGCGSGCARRERCPRPLVC